MTKASNIQTNNLTYSVVNQSPIWNFEEKRRNIFKIYIKNNEKLIIYNKKQKAKSKKQKAKRALHQFPVSTK